MKASTATMYSHTRRILIEYFGEDCELTRITEGDEDLTVLRIVVEGRTNGIACRQMWDLLDYYDRQTNTTSMSRTTAFPCAIVGRLIASGQINQTGVIPPELLGRRPDLVIRVLGDLAHRGVKFEQTFEKL